MKTSRFLILVLVFILHSALCTLHLQAGGGVVISPGNGSGGGGATNGIQMLNGSGTNTTLVTPTASGGNIVITNSTQGISLSNQSSVLTVGKQYSTTVPLTTGPGNITGTLNSRSWSTSVAHGLEVGNLLVPALSHQLTVNGIVDSTHFTTFEVADANYSGAWQYYPNYHYIGDSQPIQVGALMGDGGLWVLEADVSNSGAIWQGSGTHTWKNYLNLSYASLGAFLQWRTITSIPVSISETAPEASLFVLPNGNISVRYGITNFDGTAIPFTVGAQFKTGYGTPSAGKVLTATDGNGSAAWSNAASGGITTLTVPKAFLTNGSLTDPVISNASWVTMASTNADYSTGAYQRKETASTLAIQLTNEPNAGWMIIKVRNQTTANTFTLTASSGRTNYWEGNVSNPSPMDNAFAVYSIVFDTNENHIAVTHTK